VTRTPKPASKKSADPALASRLRRRGFLGVAAGIAAVPWLGGTAQAATTSGTAPAPSTHPTCTPLVPKGRLGIQLYTLRDKIAELGFAEVFKELVNYGYQQVEFAGYTQGTGDISLAELRKLLREHDLTGIGSHVGYYSDDPDAYTFDTQLEKVLDDAAALGVPHVGTAASPDRYGRTVDAWKRAADDFNRYGEAARKRGLKFYQHNHQMEFGFADDRPDVRLYDVLLAETDPELVFLEMDIYWAYAGQFRFSTRPDGTAAPFEPLDYVLEQPHRYPLFHVKDGEHDESAEDGYQMVDVGDGDIDYKTFLKKVGETKGGQNHNWQVEHDQPTDSLRTAHRSAAYLRRLCKE
jgi:sugar phosphate isomerase/epimerase